MKKLLLIASYKVFNRVIRKAKNENLMKSKQPHLSNQTEFSEIEKIFYENFTKRQDSNNDFLLKLLITVGTVIAGYAYLLFKVDAINVDKKIMFSIVIFIEVLLIIFFKIIYDEGFAFRRDQLVVYRILKKYGLISENKEDDEDPSIVFTYYFNPLKKYEYLGAEDKVKRKIKTEYFLLPAFHNTLASAILVIQFTVYASFCIRFLDSIYMYGLVVVFLGNCYGIFKIVKRKKQWMEDLYKKEFKAVERSKFSRQKNESLVL